MFLPARGIKRLNKFCIQYMPGKQKMIKEVRESIRLLRRVGKECIEKRREAIQSEKEMPTDILTQILKGDGRKHIAVQVHLSLACFS